MSRAFRHAARRPRNGYALVAVLWLTVLLTAVALDVSRRARLERLTALNVIDEVVLTAALNASVEQARSLLDERLRSRTIGNLNERDDIVSDPWGDLGFVATDTTRLTNVRFITNARDVAAMLNINTAGNEEIASLFAAFDVTPDDARAIAVSICARRDSRVRSDLRVVAPDRGAGTCASQSAAAFTSVDEVTDAIELPPELWRQIAPLMTVFGSGRVNLRTASAPVLMTLPGFTGEVVDAVFELRTSGARLSSLDDLLSRLSFSARAGLVAARPVLDQRVTYETTEVEVRSQAWTAGGVYGESISLVRQIDRDLAPRIVRVR